MPFKSEKQRKYLWANEPEIARDWTKTYGSKVKKADGGISQLVKPGPGRSGYRGSPHDDSRTGSGTSSGGSYGGSKNFSGGNQGSDHGHTRFNPGSGYYGGKKTTTTTPDGNNNRGNVFTKIFNKPKTYINNKRRELIDKRLWKEILQDREDLSPYAKTLDQGAMHATGIDEYDFSNMKTNANVFKNPSKKGDIQLPSDKGYPGLLGVADKVFQPIATKEGAINTFNRLDKMKQGIGNMNQTEFNEMFSGPPRGTGGEGGGNPYIYPYGMADASTTTDGTKTTTDEAWTPNFFVEDRFVSGPRRAKTRAAQGGRIGYDDGGDVMMASYGYDDAMAETFQMYLDGQKNGTVPIDMEFDEFLELLPDQSKAPQQDSGIMAAAMGGRAEYNRGGISDLVAGAPEIRLSGDVRPQFQEQQETIQGPGFTEQETTEEASMPAIMDTLNEMSMQIFGKPFDQLNDREKQSLQELSAQTLQEEGGRERAAYGGIMESATGRRAYGFGSFFKSVTKPFKKAAKVVKKVAKSPLGKMALGYLATAGMANLAGGMGGAQPWSKFKWLKPEMLKGNLFGTVGSGGSRVGQNIGKYIPGTEGILGKLNLTKGFGGLKPTALGMITGASTAAGLMTKKPPEEFGSGIGKDRKEESDWWKNYLADMRSTYGDFELEDQYKLAEGGRIGKEEGGLMNLGGVEKDYRETGGFVEIGGEEKADDVPARLSRNEFVMTADAVRGAGNGDIDKGAAIMEDTMKTLETQGKKGAQDMFETSERIGEII